MLTYSGFAGINNVLPQGRMSGSDLIVATDIDVGRTGEISRRSGLVEASVGCHKNLHQADGFMLATCGSALTAIHPNGTRHVIHPSLGYERVWYCNLPDGRVTYTNGLIHGVTDGVEGMERSVPAPELLGAASDLQGRLNPGEYRYHLTLVRTSDAIEGPAASSLPFAVNHGGVRIDGIGRVPGHNTNVYLSGPGGEGAYLAGSTSGGVFEYTGSNHALMLPCRTLGAQPFPVGTITAFWRGRVLVASGDVLWASRPNAPHLTDWRDFKPLGSQITAVQPVDDGIYVGTEQDLIWLGGGASWDALSYTPTARGPVIPGSGAAAPGDKIKMGDGTGVGRAMLCIAGGEIVAGFNGGQTVSLTDGRYHAVATEVCATFREVGGIPQYLAVPQ